jgi:hypothetical protein
MQQTSPILILGINRSGTTLLSMMLDAHSRIAIPHESHFFVSYYKERASLNFADETGRREVVGRILAEPFVRSWDRPVTAAEVDLTRCHDLASTIDEVYRVYAQHFGKDIWGDKTPAYITDIHVLNALFPDARFVHLIRDGRDVALSIIKQPWGPSDFLTAIRQWAETVLWARKMLRMLPDERHIELRFEELVSDPQAQLERLTNFLGVDFEPGMLTEYTKNALEKVGDFLNKHHVHLGKRPQRSQAFKWQSVLGPGDQAVAYELAGSVLEELGYPAGVKQHPLRIMKKCYHRLVEAYRFRLAPPPPPLSMPVRDFARA